MLDKKRILFVDDERKVLDGLRRMLHSMRHQWEMVFAESGQAALEILAASPCDVIVSDMRMPGMDGAQLLQEVQTRYPGMVRIILSGQSDQEKIMRSIGPTHRYLAKPCDAETLRQTVESACALRTRLRDVSLIQIISQMETLPSLPSLYLQILDEMRKPGSSLAKAGEIISKDMGMTAKILKIANSAFFGSHHHMSDPAQAATLLGLDLLKAMILQIHVFEQCHHQNLEQGSMDLMWNHSAMTAMYARLIVKAETSDRQCLDDACTAGLLHDVGKLVLLANLPERFQEALTLREETGMLHWEAEQQIFGSTHQEVGAYLLDLWGLPDTVVEAVAFHHIPAMCGKGGFSPLTAVHVADTFAWQEDLGKESQLDQRYLDALGLAGRIPKWKAVCQEAVGAEVAL